MSAKYRLIIGEIGNPQEHIIKNRVTTLEGAKKIIFREIMLKHNGNGWGYIEENDGTSEVFHQKYSLFVYKNPLQRST